MRILVHDFAGHPFQAQLSRALAARGHVVVHGTCGGVTTGQGDLARRPGDPPGLRFVRVSDAPFDRYSPLGRLRSEVAYGRRLSALARQVRPDVVLSANTPLLAQARLWATCRIRGIRRLYWLQDFLGRGTRAVLAERSRLLGDSLGRSWEALERSLLRRSDGVVAIAPDFCAPLAAAGVRAPTIVVENWAPLDEITVGARDNAWRTAAGLADRRVAVYAGTLGLKHDPEHLVAAARALDGTDGVVAVVSEGLGRDALEVAKAEGGLDALVLFDFVPYDELGQVLATADVCLVLLEADAGTFSVPSKVLSYLSAGRGIVAAMPAENLGARTIERAGAGEVVTAGDHEAFARSVAGAMADPDRCRRWGEGARRYAEANFDVDRIADAVLGLMEG